MTVLETSIVLHMYKCGVCNIIVWTMKAAGTDDEYFWVAATIFIPVLDFTMRLPIMRCMKTVKRNVTKLIISDQDCLNDTSVQTKVSDITITILIYCTKLTPILL